MMVGFVAGVFVGGFLGVLFMCLVISGKSD
ncbi:MAG: DUF3789 domain-containing protein [Ruminococcus sp.]|nr:DUF3789 domain-containing protein [Ruminococcus sp.]